MHMRLMSSTLVLVLAGCVVGPRVARYDLANSPAGAMVDARLGQTSISGELLAVNDSAMIVLRGGEQIMEIPFHLARLVQTYGAGSVRLDRGRKPDASGLRYMAARSRYPQGISPTLMSELLRAYGQESVGRPADSPSVPDSEVTEHLHQAREATAKFQDRREAILAGYRRIGPDFPGMGEHWIHLGNLMSGVDPERPTFLSYAEIGGVPRLVGLAYAAPLGERDEPPSWPGVAGVWHDHVGSIDEEVLLTQASAHASGAKPRARLAMMHAWVWLENPDGPFAKENWALPFARLGLEPPHEPPVSAARALTLVTHREYYTTLLNRLPVLTERDREHVRALLDEHARRAELIVTRRAGARLDDAGMHELIGQWEQLWMEAERNVTPAASTQLSALLGPRTQALHTSGH